jgi:hypothetical protein
MPTDIDYGFKIIALRQLKIRRDKYRAKLIAKGVVNGSRKMMTLMARKQAF